MLSISSSDKAAAGSTFASWRYPKAGREPLFGRDSSNGWVDTGDLVELRGDRYFFMGRRGGIINVGGQKVHPEEVEAVINRHPAVHSSLVKARKSPVMGVRDSRFMPTRARGT